MSANILHRLTVRKIILANISGLISVQSKEAGFIIITAPASFQAALLHSKVAEVLAGAGVQYSPISTYINDEMQLCHSFTNSLMQHQQQFGARGNNKGMRAEAGIPTFPEVQAEAVQAEAVAEVQAEAVVEVQAEAVAVQAPVRQRRGSRH